MNSILTFDVGTTAIKTCLFNQNLELIAIRNHEYDLCTENGCVELDSSVYWDTICRAVKEIGRDTSLDNVDAICITTQGETMIPLDAQGQPLHRAVVWLDDRAKAQAAQIETLVSHQELYELTGVTDMNGFTPLAKLLWFRQQRPDIYEKTHKFLLLEDYLLYRLTGNMVTEKSLLTSTAYYDIRHDRYWTELLEKLDIQPEKLPQICDCGEEVGFLTQEAAAALGLSSCVRVFAGAMDQIAAAIGGGGLQNGVVTATIGTALVLTSVISAMDQCTDDSLIVYRGIRPDQYVILPLCSTAGAVFKWFKDQCSAQIVQQAAETGADVYDLLCQEADQVAPGADGVILLPYFAGSMQPKCIPEAKGVFSGLSVNTSHASMTRAVLESIGFMLRENLEMLQAFGMDTAKLHFFGGGSKNPIWNQIIADITGVELVTMEQSECGSLGAAMLGAVSMGWYPDIPTAQNKNRIKYTVKPDARKKEIYDRVYEQYQLLFQSLLPIFK